MVESISVIGAGTMGNGISHVFAQHGFKVSLIDISQTQLDSAIDLISKNLERQLLKNIITDEIKKAALKNITVFTSLQTGVRHADLDRKSTRLNSSHRCISYAVFCLK